MSALLLTLLSFLVTVGVLITVHEYGHYRVARACGVKVLRFSLGFGPVLWQRRFGADRCEFVLSAIPLGGYVRMLDEADGPVDASELPRAFNRRPLWQRALVILAGPVANLVLAVVLFAAAQWYGVKEIAPILSAPQPGSLLERAGLRPGDRVHAVNDSDDEDGWRDVRSFDELYEVVATALMDQRPLRLQVSQPSEGQTRLLRLGLDTLETQELDRALLARIGLGMPYSLPVIGEILPNGPAARAGLVSGDHVQTVDGLAVADAQTLRERIRAYGSADRGAARALPPMQWEVRRNGAVLTIPVQPRSVDDRGERVGRVDAAIGVPFEQTLVQDDPLDAMRFGVVETWRRATLNLRMFGRMLIGEASVKNLSGPITIADVAGKSANRGMAEFLIFLAQVSVGIGVLNLLPLPMLDGGRLLYYLVEGTTGRPVSELWQDRLQRGGVFILLLLMSLALSNDVARLLGLQ